MLEKAKDTNSKIRGEKLHNSHLNIFNVSLWPWEQSCCHLSPSLWWQTQSGCQSSSSDEFIKACWMQSIDWLSFTWLMTDEGAERCLLKRGQRDWLILSHINPADKYKVLMTRRFIVSCCGRSWWHTVNQLDLWQWKGVYSKRGLNCNNQNYVHVMMIPPKKISFQFIRMIK